MLSSACSGVAKCHHRVIQQPPPAKKGLNFGTLAHALPVHAATHLALLLLLVGLPCVLLFAGSLVYRLRRGPR
jgi:hypothetical protein